MKKDKIVYCTYFDRGFLLKGLALHESLTRYNPRAKLWILTFDVYTEKILNKIKLGGVKVIPLRSFEDKELLAVKPSRSLVEYYWTCTPSWVLYVLKKSNASCVVYLDADVYFYSDADPAVREMGRASVLAVEHRFPAIWKIMERNTGRFNVSFNAFRNDRIGIHCLNRWRKQCIDWCYWRLEDGKLGDQMYLDEWPKLYGKYLAISGNIGVNTAPWNVSQYEVSEIQNKGYVNNIPLVSYHFHQFQILSPNHFSRTLGYLLSGNTIKYIYLPYEKEIRKQFERIRKIDSDFKIEKTESDKREGFREKITRSIGPTYWRLKSLLYNAGARLS
jgi:hypothetical protein